MFVSVYENGTKMAFLTCEVPPLEEALVLAAQQVAKHRALVETPLVPCRQNKRNTVCIVLFSYAEFVPSLSRYSVCPKPVLANTREPSLGKSHNEAFVPQNESDTRHASIAHKNSLFEPFIYKKLSFYQDGLGTNIGKTQTKTVSHRARAPILPTPSQRPAPL